MRPEYRWVMGAVLMALIGWFVSGGKGTAADDKNLPAAVRKVAEAEARGDKDAAEKQAKAIATDDLDLEDVMNVFRPRKGKTGGFGVGPTPNAIQPDGIEKKIQALARDGIRAADLGKEAEPLVQLGYDAAAVADVALQKPPKPEGKKTPALWKEYGMNMHGAALDLSKAAKSRDAEAVSAAAKKLNVSCNKCHTVFRD